MRSEDMRAGEAYVLRGDRGIKVTVLDTPAEVRARARVRVRFESGVKAGEIVDVPSVRVARRWVDRHIDPEPPERRKRPSPTTLRVPEVGDAVTWTETGPLVWTVDEIDENRQATISALVFEQPTTQTLPLTELDVHVDDRDSDTSSTVPRAVNHQPTVPGVEAASSAPEHLRPVQPQREIDALLEDVLFSNECLEQYRRRYAKRLAGSQLNERLREEIRRSGFVIHGGVPGSGEYARLRVPRRFDVVLKRLPTADEPVSVRGLAFARHGRDYDAVVEGKAGRRTAR